MATTKEQKKIALIYPRSRSTLIFDFLASFIHSFIFADFNQKTKMEQRKQKKTASISHNEFQTSENRKNKNRNLTGIMMMILMLICCCCLCLHSKNTCSHHHHHQPYQQRASIRDCSETIILFVRKILWKNIQNIFENQKKTMVSNFF